MSAHTESTLSDDELFIQDEEPCHSKQAPQRRECPPKKDYVSQPLRKSDIPWGLLFIFFIVTLIAVVYTTGSKLEKAEKAIMAAQNPSYTLIASKSRFDYKLSLEPKKQVRVRTYGLKLTTKSQFIDCFELQSAQGIWKNASTSSTTSIGEYTVLRRSSSCNHPHAHSIEVFNNEYKKY